MIEYREDPFKAERSWLNRDPVSHFIVMELRWISKILVCFTPPKIQKKLRARAHAKSKRQRAKANRI